MSHRLNINFFKQNLITIANTVQCWNTCLITKALALPSSLAKSLLRSSSAVSFEKSSPKGFQDAGAPVEGPEVSTDL